jgi:tRNA(Ile)-lysidine synthase
MATEHPLEVRVRQHLLALGLGRHPLRVVVALSGGCDSVVLLHLLRFRLPPLQFELSAGHLDHAMREGSAADADWVRGLCAAWEVPLDLERLQTAPRAEADARAERYSFLRRVAVERGAELVATAHHADDQAETVLFRAVRGTGLKGLAGIAPLADGLLRPLLPLWRREIERYARECRLSWRTDATNAELDPARNRIRHQILPLIEQRVSPSARRSLVSLAALAGEAERALERMASAAENDLVGWEEGTPWVARDRLRLYDSAVASRVLRNLLRHFGVVLGRTGTRRALQFITDARSGRQLPLSGNLRVEIEFDRAVFRRGELADEDHPYRIDSTASSQEVAVRIGGTPYRFRISWGERSRRTADTEGSWVFRGDASSLAFPLLIRGWRDGDRMRTARGRRSLKKVFLEQRIPRERRRRLPLLVDAKGEVIWVAGMAADATGEASGGEAFVLQVLHD